MLYGVYGAAGCGRGIMPLLRAQVASQSDARCVFVDDGAARDTTANGHDVLGLADFAAASGKKLIALAVADPAVRRTLASKCGDAGLSFVSVVAEEHVRMDDCEVGEGALFSPFTTLTSNIRIGRHFHCNLYSYVEHDCVIGDFVTFAPAVRCNGNVSIGDGAYIGSNAVIRQGVSIGAGAVVGMGAVVVKDVPGGATVVGNPAKLRPV